MADATVTTVDFGPNKVACRVVVNAPVAGIFALVANPHRHPELAGSGTVRDVPYKMTSTVTAFEDNGVVEWQHPLGHKWRWELQEASPTTTQVTETFD